MNDFGFPSGKEFAEACRLLLGRMGTLNGAYLLRFNDGGLKIEGSTLTSEMEIEYKYHRKNGGTLTNPVIMVADNGDIFRCHGEWTYGRERVRAYLDDPVVARLTYHGMTMESHYAHQD